MIGLEVVVFQIGRQKIRQKDSLIVLPNLDVLPDSQGQFLKNLRVAYT